MIRLTLGELATLVDGRLAGAAADRTVTAPVTVDSREVTPGGLFAAYAGEHADGHDFAAAAVDAGAVAVLGTRAVEGAPTVVVADVTAALGSLVARRRRRILAAREEQYVPRRRPRPAS